MSTFDLDGDITPSWFERHQIIQESTSKGFKNHRNQEYKSNDNVRFDEIRLATEVIVKEDVIWRKKEKNVRNLDIEKEKKSLRRSII